MPRMVSATSEAIAFQGHEGRGFVADIVIDALDVQDRQGVIVQPATNADRLAAHAAPGDEAVTGAGEFLLGPKVAVTAEAGLNPVHMLHDTAKCPSQTHAHHG